MSDLVGNLEDRFSHDAAYVSGVYRCDNEKTCSTDEDCAASTVAGGNCIQPYGKDTHHCCILAIPIIQPPAGKDLSPLSRGATL